ncbi:hypothetical protein ACLOJK_016804 [Asimina triloba]
MGTCISKCQTTSEECKQQHIQIHKPCTPPNDEEFKYPILRSPSPPTIPTSKNQHSPPPTYSPVSSSSTTASDSSNVSSISTATSTTSSLNLKDRSFSNDFLKSCIKDNPHILKAEVSPRKQAPTNKSCVTTNQEWRIKTNAAAEKQQTPRIPQIQYSQPTQVITRQKSSREDHTRRRSPAASIHRRNSGGQSPSRRFNGGGPAAADHREPLKKSVSSRRSLSPSHSRRFNAQDVPGSSPIARRGLSSSPSRRFINGTTDRCRSFARNRTGSDQYYYCKCRSTPFMENEVTRPAANCVRQIKSQFDRKAVGDAVSSQESDSLCMEDMDNPQVALDCFIFL